MNGKVRSLWAQLAGALGDIFLTLTEEFGFKRSRSLGLTGVSCLGSTLLATGKLLIGLLSLSLFTCLNAFYSFCMVAAKNVALAGVVRERNRRGQHRYCRLAALMLIAASLCYMIYTIHLYYVPPQYRYEKFFAIGIAAFAFTELSVSLWGVIQERRRGMPLFQTIKTINLSSALMALVLTQRATLSLTLPPERTAGINALFGMLMALISALLGIGLYHQMRHWESATGYQYPFEQLRKLASRNYPQLQLRPAYYIECGSRHYLGIHIAGDREAFLHLRSQAEQRLNLHLLDADILSAKDALSRINAAPRAPFC